MALYPLCHHGEDPESAIRHAAAAIEANAADVLERRDFLTFLGIYAMLRYPLVSALDIIGREKMRESAFAQEWMEEATLIKGRADILKALRLRLKATQTEEFASALALIKEPDHLDRLFDVALTCSTLDEFREALSSCS